MRGPHQQPEEAPCPASRARPSSCAALAALAVPSSARADNYVALGDSYSSGVGTNSYTLSSSCLRGVYAYPYLDLAAAPEHVAELRRLLRRDDDEPDVEPDPGRQRLDEHRHGHDRRQRHRLLEPDPAVHARQLQPALNSTRAGLNTSLAPKLNTVYSAIKARAPSATVVVLGYPRLFSTSSCLGTTGISAQERSDANLLADAVDSVTAARAAAYGFTYKSAITLVHRARRLLGQRVAQRSEHLQHDRELPPEPSRQRQRLRAAGAPGHRLT